MIPSPLFHLSSLLFYTLRIGFEFDNEEGSDKNFAGTLFQATIQHKTFIVSTYNRSLLIDNVLVDDGRLLPNSFTVHIQCLKNLGLQVTVPENGLKKAIFPSFLCSGYKNADLLILPSNDASTLLYGCVRNITHGNVLLVDEWCRHSPSSKTKTLVARSIDRLTEEKDTLIYFGERLKVEEGKATRIKSKNIALFSAHKNLDINDYTAVKFEVINEPEHGYLTIANVRSTQQTVFSYDDVLNERVEYRHDGSETIEDFFNIRIKILETTTGLHEEILEKLEKSGVFTVFVDIKRVDDPPQLKIGSMGPIINLAIGAKVKLGESHLRVWDADTPTKDVWLEIVQIDGARILNKDGIAIQRFNLASLLNGNVFLASEGGNGKVEFLARDATNRSASTITLRISSVPVAIYFRANTGLQLPHRSSRPISAQNLSFYSNFPEVSLRYLIVDQPEFGLIECYRYYNLTGTIANKPMSEDPVDGSFQLCSEFEQSDIDALRIRYRHLSINRPQSDTFSFQVHCADVSTSIHVFHINFIPVSFRVFIQETLLLNNTDQTEILQRNLLATSFPIDFPPNELVYHVVEPPKFGMLSRKIELGSGAFKYRRIGVSSNFTQQHINDVLIKYKLHFVHYSIVNDFFSFRLITPAVTSELLKFEITYIPGPNSIHLVNRTLIVSEGAMQQITNNTLWLETADDSNFLFTLTIPPFNGRLLLTNEVGAKFHLDISSNFTSMDIINKRLFYEHSGDETLFDRTYLFAESINRKDTRIPLWLTISIVGQNDNPPYLRIQSTDATDANENIIYMIDDSERVLHPSLLFWADPDDTIFGWPSLTTSNTGRTGLTTSTVTQPLSFHFMELYRDFIICNSEFPELSIRNFTQRQLKDRSLIVRHLNLKKNYNKLSYIVSDGTYTVTSTLVFAATKPFVQLTFNRTFIPVTLSAFSNGDAVSTKYYLALTNEDIFANTNIDTDLNDIVFERLHSASLFSMFRILHNGTFSVVDKFWQRDIFENRLFLTLVPSLMLDVKMGGVQLLTIPMRIIAKRKSPLQLSSSRRDITSVTQVTADVAFTIERCPLAKWKSVSKQLRVPIIFKMNSDGIHSALGSSSVIESKNVFGVVTIDELYTSPSALDIKFWLSETPRFGALILQSSKKSSNLSSSHSTITKDSYLTVFRQRDLDLSQLFYLNNPSYARNRNLQAIDEDSFSVNISIPTNRRSKTAIIGPVKFPIKLMDTNQLILIAATNLNAKFGSNLILRSRALRVSIPSDMPIDLDNLEYRIVEMPPDNVIRFGQLKNMRKDGEIILNAFSHADLTAGNIWFSLNDSLMHSSEELSRYNNYGMEWHIRVCASSARQSKCSAAEVLRIRIDMDNRFGPQLVRNEILSISSTTTRTLLTEKYLKAADNDTSSFQLKFLVWQSVGGFVEKRKTQDSPFLHSEIYSFSQADLNEGLIAFSLHKNMTEHNDRSQGMESSGIGFSFLVTDGLHQTRPAWFSIRQVSASLLEPTEKESSQFIPNDLSNTHFMPKIFLESNARLNAVPGIVARISSDILKAKIENVLPQNTYFIVTRLPLYGRIMIEGSIQRPIENFTQNDINAGRVYYLSQSDLGSWSQHDSFSFIIQNRNDDNNENKLSVEKPKSVDEAFRFRIFTSYSNAHNDEVNKFVFNGPIYVGQGGSVLLNASHLNLTKLSLLCDDIIFIDVDQWPRCGTIQRVSDDIKIYFPSINNKPIFSETIAEDEHEMEDENEAENQQLATQGIGLGMIRAKMPLRAEEFSFGKELFYHHHINSTLTPKCQSGDEIVLHIYSFREKQKRLFLNINLQILVLPSTSGEKVINFVPHLSMISGSKLMINSEQFQVIHSTIGASQLNYKVFQPQSKIRFFMIDIMKPDYQMRFVSEFTQSEVNKRQIGIEHFPSLDENTNEYETIGLQVGGSHTKILYIRIEPFSLRLRNHTSIGYVQGKTYVVLNSGHLGAESNDDPEHIIYNITRMPVNGSLYWVAGEKQANTFTQKNIDDGDVLYAQLNMNAFQDSFNFVLSNDEMEILEKTSQIIVQPAIQLQPFVTRSRTIVQISLIDFNVSQISHTSPRFFVVHPPNHGRLFLRPKSNVSATFFTHLDIIDGHLFFHAFNVEKRVVDNVELELIADNIQPARLSWIIDIRPNEDKNEDTSMVNLYSTQKPSTMDDADIPKISAPPEIDYQFPIFILLGIVALIAIMALCHWRSSGKRKKKKPTKVVDEDSSSNRRTPRTLPDLNSGIDLKKSVTISNKSIQTPAKNRAPFRSILINSAVNNTLRATCSAATTTTTTPTTSTGILSQKCFRKPDLLSSTVYASISPTYGINASRNNIDKIIDKSLSFYPRTNLNSRNNTNNYANSEMIQNSSFCSNSFAIKPSIFTALNDNPSLRDSIHLSDDISQLRMTENMMPIIATNPAAQRFIVPSRRPVAVSAIVPTMETFETTETHSLSLPITNNDNEALPTKLESPNNLVFMSFTTSGILPSTSSPLTTPQRQSQLAMAAASAVATRNAKDSISDYSDTNSSPPPPPPLQISRNILTLTTTTATDITNMSGRDGETNYIDPNHSSDFPDSDSNGIHLKENQYWV